ncbi:MAG TPA: hypothetical protein VE690_19895 [Rhodopila sp.]|nr:hypothetical protein [Rhodopila sp.]
MDVKAFTLDDKADPTFNQLLGINNNGVIAGYFGSGADPAHPNKGYTVKPGYTQNDFMNENFPNSVQTQVTGINNKNLTVGFYVDPHGNSLGFVDNGGHFTSVFDSANGGAVPLSGSGQNPAMEQLLGVNDKDIAVGFYMGTDGQNHGFTYDIDHNSFKAVNVSGFTNVTAAAINNDGDIAGFGTDAKGRTEGFVLDSKGKVTELTGPTGAVSVNALGINKEDEVVGSYMDAQGNTHGFVFDERNGKYTTIDAGAKTETVINGLNDKEELVGFYMDAQGNTHGLLIQGSNR